MCLIKTNKQNKTKVSRQIPQNEKQYFHNVMYCRCSFEKHISHVCEKKILRVYLKIEKETRERFLWLNAIMLCLIQSDLFTSRFYMLSVVWSRIPESEIQAHLCSCMLSLYVARSLISVGMRFCSLIWHSSV